MSAPEKLQIRGDLTIYQALDTKQQLLDLIAGNEHIELDLSGVGDVDAAGLQLLIFAKREAQRLNKRLAIVAHSDSVRETLDFCNLTAFFGDPVVISAREGN